MSDKNKRNKRVVVGMSGGVDSSVAAALLLEEGYDVIGVTMEIGLCALNGHSEPSLSMEKAVTDARIVANSLGIPHYVMNFRNLFTEKVINYFTAEYLRGKTPNPCIACNRYIKFGEFLEEAKKLDADYIATGHYARIEYDVKNDRFSLMRGKDLSKDQSYVLYNLGQEQLKHILFPLGIYTKGQIRQKAEQLNLTVAKKSESQEICFIPDNDYKGFLQKQVTTEEIKPGFFLNTKGEVIGNHAGLPYYTVGQRKGLGMALGYPAYVVAIQPEKNTVIIGREEEVFQQGLWSINNNFIDFDCLQVPLEIEAKIRYSAKPAPAEISWVEGERVRVLFHEPQRAITPGQSVVYYRGDRVIGGGVIEEVIHSSG
ncbi:MAG: tRNA 2-thiouridine(34) synthase MnmA [Firmicutes bacterium HGW-Firmicutes-12]|nr:MAG: tRNA 2-thiouridine(34) synthase MnmA [Firmicutes bacterium HGW-Firmicutes-12]